MDATTTGSENTAIGRSAMDANTTGASNVAVGRSALAANTTGARNIAIGHDAYVSSDTESDNIAIGYSAMTTNTAGGQRNIAIGNYAADAMTSGDDNVAIGNQALGANNAGVENTAVGGNAGVGITGGVDNTVVGFNACNHVAVLSTGSYNVIIGQYSHTTAVDTDRANVLGHGVGGAGGYTTVGNGSDDIRAANGNVTWATVSDERYKKDIVDSTAGLSFVNALQPRTFKYKNKGELPSTFSAYKADSTEVFKNSDTNHGFIAQEVKAAIDSDSSIKDGFRLWDDRDDGSQEVAEAALIPVLVKAMQELSTKVDTLTLHSSVLEQEAGYHLDNLILDGTNGSSANAGDDILLG